MSRSISVVLRTALTTARLSATGLSMRLKNESTVFEAFFALSVRLLEAPRIRTHRFTGLHNPQLRFTFMSTQPNIKFCQDLS
jgi:hypothetical protein